MNNKGTTTSISADLSLFCCACVGGGAGPVARHQQELLAAERIEKPQLDSPKIYLNNKGTGSLFRINVIQRAVLWIRIESGFNGIPGSGFGSRRSKMEESQ